MTFSNDIDYMVQGVKKIIRQVDFKIRILTFKRKRIKLYASYNKACDARQGETVTLKKMKIKQSGSVMFCFSELTISNSKSSV